MKKTLTILILFALLAITHATSTDGNYTLLQYDLQGSGTTTTLTDSNYVLFAEVGEPATSENLSDSNIAAAAGFFGEAILAIAIAEEVAAAVTRTLIIALAKNPTPIALIILAIVAAGSIFGAMIFVKQKNKTKEEGEEK